MFQTIKFLCLALMLCPAFTAVGIAQESRAPSTAEQYVLEGYKNVQDKQYDKAVEAYKQAIKINPELADGHHGLATVYMSTGRVADALEPLKTAVRLAPDNAIIHLNIGIAYALLRRPDESLAELNTAKQLRPNDPKIYVEIGNVLHNSFGRIEDALNMDLEARKLDPKSPVVHHNIGLMLMRLGRFAEAAASLEEALRLDPKYRNARYLLSDAYSKVGRYDDAADSWTKFLEIVPNGPEALTKRAWNYLYAGAHGREAAEDARTYLKVYGWNDENSPYLAIMANLGYRQAGMSDEAQRILVEAAKKIRSDKFTYQIIRYLKEEISSEELLKIAADNDNKTEARTYLGMDLLLKGKADEARTQFNWVKEYGNRRFYEFPLAVEELKRMNKSL